VEKLIYINNYGSLVNIKIGEIMFSEEIIIHVRTAVKKVVTVNM